MYYRITEQGRKTYSPWRPARITRGTRPYIADILIDNPLDEATSFEQIVDSYAFKHRFPATKKTRAVVKKALDRLVRDGDVEIVS